MLKIKRNIELEDIYCKMVFSLIESRRECVKVTKLHDFAIAVKDELDVMKIVMTAGEPPSMSDINHTDSVKREECLKRLEEWDKKYIKEFITLPYESLKKIYDIKKNMKKDCSAIEERLYNMYDALRGGRCVDELSVDYEKENWKDAVTLDGSNGKMILKPYQLIEMMQNTAYCLYCNSSETSSRDILIGGELDHFFPRDKKIAPLLAICLYNLIPTCSRCNKPKSNEGNFQSPYDSAYDIDSVNFLTKFNPKGNVKDSLAVSVKIKKKHYDTDLLRRSKVSENNIPILNNFIKMRILDSYNNKAGKEQISEMISNMKMYDLIYVKGMAKTANMSMEDMLTDIYGDVLVDENLVAKQKGKYKRDFLLQHNIVKKEGTRYLFNNDFKGVKGWN